jgi:hypothetical protein
MIVVKKNYAGKAKHVKRKMKITEKLIGLIARFRFCN